MIIVIACIVAIAVIAFVLGVRAKDVPEPESPSPFEHLDERKAAIYENLRDLQFEYRLGKLSDEDYQGAKKGLQKELAQVLAAVDKLKAELTNRTAPAPQPAPSGLVCPSCGASFEKSLKFCGECGKPMKVTA